MWLNYIYLFLLSIYIELMNDLVTVLEQQNYFSIPFRIRKSNHLFVHAKVNRIKGLFLIDTGASNTCIDSNEKSFFKLLEQGWQLPLNSLVRNPFLLVSTAILLLGLAL